MPKDVSSHNHSQIPVPFLSSCLAELITIGFENHCMDLEMSVSRKLSRHGIFICFSIPTASTTDLQSFTARCAWTPGNFRSVCWVPEDKQPGLRAVSNTDSYFLEMLLEITKKNFERYFKKLPKIAFPFESILAVTQTQRRQHWIKHSAWMQFQISFQGQNIRAIQLLKVHLGKSWDALLWTWVPPKSYSKRMAT